MISSSLLPIVSVEEVDRDTVNALFEEWRHPLGACKRPFGHFSHVLLTHGQVVAATHTASIVSPTVEGYGRKRVVELARIGRADSAPWAMRVMLRLWREAIAQQVWHYWTVEAAVSYSIPGYSGNVYRFDGWTKVKDCRPARPGKSSHWAKGSATDAIGDGKKGLWMYHYNEVTEAA